MLKNVLITGYGNSIFIKKFKEKIKEKTECEFLYFLDSSDYSLYKNDEIIFKFRKTFVKKIDKFLYTKKIEKYLCKTEFDVVNIHFLAPGLYTFLKFFKKNKSKMLVTFWGSDLFRINSKLNNYFQKKILENSGFISFMNKKMKDECIKKYGISSADFFETRFGLPLEFSYFENISGKCADMKKKYGVNEDDTVITLGYSSDAEKNHEYMIDEVSKLAMKYENIFVFIPMTYGDKEHRENIKNYCNENIKNFRYKILEEYMPDEEMAVFRKITDIMVNVQNTDELSASMQESLYAGSIVIKGSWLP